MERLVIISSRCEEAVFASKDWLASAKGKCFCSGCVTVNRSLTGPYDIILKCEPEHRISGDVLWTRLHIYHKEFINQIKDYLGDFSFGKCRLTDGQVLENYVTLNNRRYILIRGNKMSKYNVCNVCGTIWPHGWHGRQYVLRSYLTDSRVYQSPFNELCIDEEIALKLDFSPWPDVDLETVEIRDEPMDNQNPPYKAEP